MEKKILNKITIRNFVVIKKADVIIKDVNIIIGQQSSGKSLIAKLIYFFNSLNEIFIEYAEFSVEEQKIEDEIYKKFIFFFPEYLWFGKAFKIRYVMGLVDISLVYKKNSDGNMDFYIGMSESFREILGGVGSILNDPENFQHPKSNEKIVSVRKKIVSLEGEVLFKEALPYYFGKNLFLPAGRSFLHTLKRNAFFLTRLQVDPFVSEFGVEYTGAKEYFAHDMVHFDEVETRAFEEVLKGHYHYDETRDEDWIVSNKGQKTLLTHASSGQQEALPMLAMLTVFPALADLEGEPGMMFIEEPEAHLFPTAQNEMVSFITSLYQRYNCRFFMTSHSPYIVSALNNAIEAHEVISSGKLTEKQFNKMNKGGASLPYEKVAAYTIDNGVAISIMDEEYKMIGAYKLDDISNHFQVVQNKLSMLKG